jgi:hypothetical protein
MKHIKRKFLNINNITKDGYEYFLENKVKPKEQTKISIQNMVPHLITNDQQFIQSFFYQLEGVKVPIPEPNPIIIYFSNAQGFLSVIIEKRNELFNELKTSNFNVDEILNHMFAFYGCVVNFTSSLFDALEAFVNSKIPKDYKFPNPRRRNKIMNKYEIIRHTSFEDKIKSILPEIYSGQNFVISKSHLYQNLILLKNLRDNITHTKADIEHEVNYYEKLFTEALDFDYLKAIQSARDFINFYENSLIEPCNCGLTH